MFRVYLLVMSVCLFIGQVWAVGEMSFQAESAPTVTLDMREVPLVKILQEIERQAGVSFSYESSLMKAYRKVSIQVENVPVEKCLEQLFVPLSIQYNRTGNIVVLKRRPRRVTISGFVRDDKVKKAAELAKIENVMSQKIETLSKGYLRRVGFAQSILSNPPILLLDEPTDGLDPNQKVHIREMIEKMGKDKTILISTHLLEEAESVCNRIILINKGQIVADGTLAQVLAQNRTKSLEKVFHKLTSMQEEV